MHMSPAAHDASAASIYSMLASAPPVLASLDKAVRPLCHHQFCRTHLRSQHLAIGNCTPRFNGRSAGRTRPVPSRSADALAMNHWHRQCIPHRSGCARRSCRKGYSGNPLSFLANQIVRWDFHIIEKRFQVVAWFIMVRIGRMLRPFVGGFPHVDEKDRQAFRALLCT